jgi:hypothetical protein
VDHFGKECQNAPPNRFDALAAIPRNMPSTKIVGMGNAWFLINTLNTCRLLMMICGIWGLFFSLSYRYTLPSALRSH